MNRQPRDILYLITAYLEYTPDTARFGRVCKYIDSIPCWYERSGHVQPHDKYVFDRRHSAAYYLDGKQKETIWNEIDNITYQRISVGVQSEFNWDGFLISQQIFSPQQGTVILRYLCATGMPWRLSKETDTELLIVTSLGGQVQVDLRTRPAGDGQFELQGSLFFAIASRCMFNKRMICSWSVKDLIFAIQTQKEEEVDVCFERTLKLK
jgi:hypothetical protein